MLNKKKTVDLIMSKLFEKYHTIYRISNCLGISEKTIHNWMNGIHFLKIEFLADIADDLGCKVDDLLVVE